MLEEIFLIRETIIGVYKRYETAFVFLLKFLAGMIVFTMIQNIEYPMEFFTGLVPAGLDVPFKILLSILFAVAPVTLAYTLAAAGVCIRLSASPGIMVFVLLFFICVLVFYVRIAAKEAWLILATVLAFYLKIPYFIPILAGLYFGLTSMIPISISVFIWTFAPVVNTMLKQGVDQTAAMDIVEIPAQFGELYTSFYSGFSGNGNWILTAFIFAMVVVIVYCISCLSIDYARDIAVCFGAVLCIIGHLIAVLVVGMKMNIGGMILSTIVSALLTELVHFFDMALNYSRVERVQFEDEKNYYYVKVIPKISLSKRKRVVRRINQDDFSE